MVLEYEAFEDALVLFHRYSLQNVKAVEYLRSRELLTWPCPPGFSILDIGAGSGYLSSLMAPYADRLVVVEPNMRCVEQLKERFHFIYPVPWDQHTCRIIQDRFTRGFHLVVMSHMLYHFQDLEDVRQKIKLALDVLRPGGHLVIVLNQSTSLTARIGLAFRLMEGRLAEVSVNQVIYQHGHQAEFYQPISDQIEQLEVNSLETPLKEVTCFDHLVRLMRMCVLDPLSKRPLDAMLVDGFIKSFIYSEMPEMRFPATLPGHDDIIVLSKAQEPMSISPAVLESQQVEL